MNKVSHIEHLHHIPGVLNTSGNNEALEASGVSSMIEDIIGGENFHFITNNNIYLSTLLYLVYWYHRSSIDKPRQDSIRKGLSDYLGKNEKTEGIIAQLISSEDLKKTATTHVEGNVLVKPTVDIVVVKLSENGDKSILCNTRNWYPKGSSLVGGFILDEDEDNNLGVDPQIFSTLRIAGVKILADDNCSYGVGSEDGKGFYYVESSDQGTRLKLYTSDTRGYKYKDKLSSMLEPTDPRHIVNTTGFQLHLEGELANKDIHWVDKSDIMDTHTQNGGFAFNHHRNIVAHLSSKNSLEKERNASHHEFMRSIVDNPLEVYADLSARFRANDNSPETSVPELLPVIDEIMGKLYSDTINEACKKNNFALGMRDQVKISLEHCKMKEVCLCPYKTTIEAIYTAVAFFDIVARDAEGFYNEIPHDKPVDHNPRTLKGAKYHMYRYEYRMHQLLAMIPNEIIIPTFENIGATDLMKIRHVPIRIAGLSDEYIYVDDFRQSPQEFWMHDINHSYRMAKNDADYTKEQGITARELADQSADFLNWYIPLIKIKKTDSKFEKEMKKLKKIILFEVIHEDTLVPLKQVIADHILEKEGYDSYFEIPSVNPENGDMDITRQFDKGISVLSYVRDKLQNGFYDNVDSQSPQIVDPEYRTAKHIGIAAYEMLQELGVDTTEMDADQTDPLNVVSFEWIMRRVCSVGPEGIKGDKILDPAMKIYGDPKATGLNERVYTT